MSVRFNWPEGAITRDPVDNASIASASDVKRIFEMNRSNESLRLILVEDSAHVRFLGHLMEVDDKGTGVEVTIICRIQPDDLTVLPKINNPKDMAGL